MGASGAEAFLRRVAETASGPYLRPFTPDAGWRNAPVLVVGTNPATPLRDEMPSFDMYCHALTAQQVFDGQKPRRGKGGVDKIQTAESEFRLRFSYRDGAQHQ